MEMESVPKGANALNIISKTELLLHIAHWRLTWGRRNTHYRFTVPGNPKFMGPRDAVKLINDGDVVATAGSFFIKSELLKKTLGEDLP